MKDRVFNASIAINSILLLFVIFLITAEVQESNAADLIDKRGQRPPFLMPRVDILNFKRQLLKSPNHDFKRDYEQPAAVRPYMSNVPMNNLVSSWWYKQQHEKRDGVGGNGGILQFGRGRSTTVPLSILDNIDTLRRGLMRELTLRRMAQDRMSMVRSSEDFKQSKGRRWTIIKNNSEAAFLKNRGTTITTRRRRASERARASADQKDDFVNLLKRRKSCCCCSSLTTYTPPPS